MNEHCLCCFKDLKKEDYASVFFQNDLICRSCRQKLGYRPVEFQLGDLKVHALYPYSGFVRDMILQYKQDHDEALAPVFLHKLKKRLERRYAGFVLAEVPSSTESIEERGFHHVSEIFSVLDLPQQQMFVKTEDFLQKNQSGNRRSDIGNSIALSHPTTIQKNVLLIDDIVTTGSSLLACYNLIKPLFYKEIRALCICYNERSFKAAKNRFPMKL